MKPQLYLHKWEACHNTHLMKSTLIFCKYDNSMHSLFTLQIAKYQKNGTKNLMLVEKTQWLHNRLGMQLQLVLHQKERLKKGNLQGGAKSLNCSRENCMIN